MTSGNTPDIPREERKYAVMTDSHKFSDRKVLARMPPACSRSTGFWTEDSPADIWEMDRKTAEEILSKLHLNNPRLVRYEKAVTLITAQRDTRAAANKDTEAVLDGPDF